MSNAKAFLGFPNMSGAAIYLFIGGLIGGLGSLMGGLGSLVGGLGSVSADNGCALTLFGETEVKRGGEFFKM